eukprot:390853_1
MGNSNSLTKEKLCKHDREMDKKNTNPNDAKFGNVTVMNIIDGSIIQDKKEVQEWFRKEDQMMKTYGPNIIFQIYKINFNAKSRQTILSEKLQEIEMKASKIRGNHTVKDAKAILCEQLAQCNTSE